MSTHFFRLGKEAARRATATSKTVKVFKPGGDKKLTQALNAEPDSARQLPWTYGEKRKRRRNDEDD